MDREVDFQENYATLRAFNFTDFENMNVSETLSLLEDV